MTFSIPPTSLKKPWPAGRRPCKPKQAWNYSSGSGMMWAVESKSTSSKSFVLPTTWTCGNSSMQWKRLSQSRNRMWPRGTPTRTNTHRNEHEVRRGPHMIQAGTCCGKLARRSKQKPWTRKLRNAKCRWRFWHSWQLATGRRLLAPSNIVKLGMLMHLAKAMFGGHLCSLSNAVGILLSMTAITISERTHRAQEGDDGIEPTHTNWTSPTTFYSTRRLGPKSQGDSSRCKICTTCILFYMVLLTCLVLTRGVSEVRVTSHASGEVGVGIAHEGSGKTFNDNKAPLQQFQWTAKRAF